MKITSSVFVGITVTALSFPICASSIYVGHSQTEQVTTVGENEVDLSPAGLSFLLNYDFDDNYAISIDFSQLDDEKDFRNQANVDFEIDTFGLGASYSSDDWSWYYQYSRFEDNQRISGMGPQAPSSQTQNKANTHSLGGSYFTEFGDSQVGISFGAHYSNWEQDFNASQQPGQAGPGSAIDEGDSSFVSIGGSYSYFFSLTEDTNMLAGVYLGWNELLDSDSAAISRNGRNVSQIRDINIRNQINSLAIAGSESYGQVNAFVSFDLGENWVLDLDSSFDFGTDQNTQAWSINLGYFF